MHCYYDAACKQWGEQWQVVDVVWDDPRRVIDAVFEAAAKAPDDQLE